MIEAKALGFPREGTDREWRGYAQAQAHAQAHAHARTHAHMPGHSISISCPSLPWRRPSTPRLSCEDASHARPTPLPSNDPPANAAWRETTEGCAGAGGGEGGGQYDQDCGTGHAAQDRSVLHQTGCRCVCGRLPGLPDLSISLSSYLSDGYPVPWTSTLPFVTKSRLGVRYLTLGTGVLVDR
ncbi:hypothetical protein K431DRAFT_108440 [Polychaeton citri CBS 116435]|uniref:Uncharacterized protein n=1 Tax=Polychaeton citri CBS 116435 TaxID=1314669 RepID=A0A9P4UMG1_9PEZI|nr:hypothetical protein K431DRAFT_108440 [Polychaeton citri CBS 116435]